MRTAPMAVVRTAVWLCAWNLLVAMLAAQCSNPTQVPNQTISSGTVNYSDNNALAASNVIVNGSASVTFVAGNCIDLQPGFRATAGTAGTTFHAWVETAPTADSVSPSSGSGLSQQFTWKASSPSGYANLSEVYTLFNTSVSGLNACYIRYNRASNLLYLADNSGSSWLGGLVPGTSGTAANSQCSINATGSSVSGSGTQLTLTVSVTFQNSFSGTKNDYLIAYNNEGLNSAWQQMGTWTVPSGDTTPPVISNLQQSPTSNSATITWTTNELADTQIEYGTTPSYGNWTALNSTLVTSHSQTIPGLAASTTYYYRVRSRDAALNLGTATGSFTTTAGSVQPLTPPTPLKGFTYFPRGHAWWDMLYHWYTQDCATSTSPASCVSGWTVAQVVSNDLATLAANGVNFIHLYLWDQDIVVDARLGDQPPVAPGSQGAGFVSWDNCVPPGSQNCGPENSPNNQWTALAEFVAQAKSRNMWVMVHMVASRPKKKIAADPSSAAAVGTDYGQWFGKFIGYLRGYENVLVWDADWDLQQPVASPSPFWHAAYPVIASKIQEYTYTNPPGRALLAVETPFGYVPHTMEPRPAGGYQWRWQEAQQAAYNWTQLANDVARFRPDLFALQLWHAHAGDLQGNLKCAAGIATDICPTPACGANCTPIQFSEMVITEFGTGTSLELPPIGNGVAFWGDAYTPTTKAAGQREYLLQALCVLKRLNINKYAYHGLYDSKSFWDSEFNLPATELAWRGFWGLKSEASAYGDKLAWPAWRDFNWNDPNNCTNVPAAPVLGLYADATYYTINDTGKITYTAANVTSLALNEPFTLPNASYSCDPLHPDGLTPADQLVGSCAFTNITAANTGTITLTGENTSVDGHAGSGLSTQVATSVTVGLAPKVNAIVNASTGQTCDLQQNPGCVITLGQRDVLTIWGEGFNPSGQNTVQLDNQSTPAWLYETDGYYFWDYSRTQINAEIGCYVLPGSYTLKVWSPHSGTPSSGATVSISAGGNCPP